MTTAMHKAFNIMQCSHFSSRTDQHASSNRMQGTCWQVSRRRNLRPPSAQRPTLDTEVPRLDAGLDDELSKRPLSLDAAGYFIIKLDRDTKEIVADFYTNIINKNGKLYSSTLSGIS